MKEDRPGGRWIPLESNPDIFNSWSSEAGLLTSKAHFTDIYGLDEELLAMVPKPVKAVILLFPDEEESVQVKNKAEDERIAREGQPHLDNTIFWVNQTISNACGTMALIHAIANSGVAIKPASPIQQYIIECMDKPPQERAKILETTPLFADIHAELAEGGQSEMVVDTDLHFTCFVQAADNAVRLAAQGVPLAEGVTEDDLAALPKRLVELDGCRVGPIDHGESQDLLTDVASFVKRTYLSSSRSVNFSMLALTEGQE